MKVGSDIQSSIHPRAVNTASFRGVLLVVPEVWGDRGTESTESPSTSPFTVSECIAHLPSMDRETSQRHLVERVFNRSDENLDPVDLPDRTARGVRQPTCPEHGPDQGDRDGSDAPSRLLPATARAEAVPVAVGVTQLDAALTTDTNNDTAIVTAQTPELLALPRVGVITAAIVLCDVVPPWPDPQRGRAG